MVQLVDRRHSVISSAGVPRQLGIPWAGSMKGAGARMEDDLPSDRHMPT
jgi:hypothetical protein